MVKKGLAERQLVDNSIEIGLSNNGLINCSLNSVVRYCVCQICVGQMCVGQMFLMGDCGFFAPSNTVCLEDPNNMLKGAHFVFPILFSISFHLIFINI